MINNLAIIIFSIGILSLSNPLHWMLEVKAWFKTDNDISWWIRLINFILWNLEYYLRESSWWFCSSFEILHLKTRKFSRNYKMLTRIAARFEDSELDVLYTLGTVLCRQKSFAFSFLQNIKWAFFLQVNDFYCFLMHFFQLIFVKVRNRFATLSEAMMEAQGQILASWQTTNSLKTRKL